MVNGLQSKGMWLLGLQQKPTRNVCNPSGRLNSDFQFSAEYKGHGVHMNF